MNKTTKLILAGAVGFMLFNKLKANNNVNTGYNYSHLPPPPPQQPQNNPYAWQQWINTMVNAGVSIASLWAEGGPLANRQDANPEFIIDNFGQYTDPNVINDPLLNGGIV